MEIPWETDAVMVPVHVNETGFEKKRPPQLNTDNQPPAQIAGGPAETDSHVGLIEVHMTRLTLNEDGYVDMDITDKVIPSDSTDASGNTGRAAAAAAAQTDSCRDIITAHATTAPTPTAEPVPGLTRADLELHRRQQLATFYSSDINEWTLGAMPRYCAYLLPAGVIDGSVVSTQATGFHGNNHYHDHNEDDIDLNNIAPGHWRGAPGY